MVIMLASDILMRIAFIDHLISVRIEKNKISYFHVKGITDDARLSPAHYLPE